MEAASAPLPELASVPWRSREDAASLIRRGRLWMLFTSAHVVPFLLAAAGLMYLNVLAFPVAFVAAVHAWIIPELYAFRGASVVRPKGPRNEGGEALAQGFLGDLLGHDARALQRDTGLVLERGRLGVWLLGEGGALLVTPDRRAHAFCVRVSDNDLPPSDRIAHLLLALRSDEEGFATVANHAFAGAAWRVRRRLDEPMRPALREALQQSVRGLPQPSTAL
ncbi:MAG TPA: hypothetical protein VGI67_09790 [Thermoleophilaceae bacterium]